MTEEQKDTFSRRDFARLTATGLGAFAVADVLFRVFRVGGGAVAYAECCECCDGACDNGCDQCDYNCDPDNEGPCCEEGEVPCGEGGCNPCDPEAEGGCDPCDPEQE